jgi:hypothetical protein
MKAAFPNDVVSARVLAGADDGAAEAEVFGQRGRLRLRSDPGVWARVDHEAVDSVGHDVASEAPRSPRAG